jgi:diguanylate cyclase (GGDEF)-like protein/PAS domain S-box-containing protein
MVASVGSKIEAHLRDALGMASDWLWETDAALRLVWLSEGFFAATGLDPKDVLGHVFYELNRLDPQSPEARAHVADLEARRPFRGHRFELLDARGFRRVLETSGRPLFDDAGGFLGYFGTALDITERVLLEEALRASEERFRSLVTNMRGIVFYRGEAGNGPYGYRQGLELYGADIEAIAGTANLDPGEIVGRWHEMVHPDDRALYLELEGRRKGAGEPFCLEYRLFHPLTGELRWIREVAWVSDGGGRRFYEGYVVDITQLKRTELALRASERRYRGLIEAAPVAILVVANGKVSFANHAAARLLGATEPSELVGNPLDCLRTGEMLAPDGHSVQVWRGLDGRRVICEVAVVPLEEGEAESFQLVLVDITARMEAQARAWFLAFHDPLTGLANRARLADRLVQALALRARRRSRLALHVIDLDGFKEVNDTLGHAAGDELLRQVAKRFAAAVRATDTLARLGGDEFAVVQVDLKAPEDAAALARRLLESLVAPFTLEGQEVHAAASIGIALCPDDAEDGEELMRRADLAMYRAKESGRSNFAFFVPALDRLVQLRRALEAELRVALEGDALFLLFQPKVEIASGLVVGAEALLRWRHPTHGVIEPDVFVPLAEKNGLIRAIGRRVLELACRQLDRWRRSGLAIPVAINVSAAQLRDSDFADHLERLLKRYALDPRLLGIEVTESLLVAPSVEEVAGMLRRIASLGVEIAIDDFGTGYSSLLNLKRLPVQTIKIDRSFVGGIGSDRDSETIVEAIVQLARALDKSVVAEGVERPEQARFLAERGCRLAQGYLYARPLEATAFQELTPRLALPRCASLFGASPR